MTYGPEMRHLVKDDVMKAKVTPETRARAKKLAAESGLQEGAWLRELIEHTITMDEVKRRLEAHNK